VRNAGRYSIVSGIGMILMFLGKAIIMGSSGLIAYIIIMNSYLRGEIYSPIFPIIVVVIISYLIGSIFLSVFSFSTTAILHCFILDEEVEGNRCPSSLLEFKKVNEEENAKKNRKNGGGGSGKDSNQNDNNNNNKRNDDGPRD
jgi:hypothetical protein